MINQTKLQMLLSLIKSGQVKVEDIKDTKYYDAAQVALEAVKPKMTLQ